MSEFTASNGETIDPLPDLYHALGYTDVQVDALREFFQHERDEQLGRWRWAANPDYVVTPFEGDPDHVLVVQESAGVACEFWRASTSGPSLTGYHSRLAPSARAYFAAHPEPKPWHDAKEGEVWVPTTENVGDEIPARVALVNGIRNFEWVVGLHRKPVDDPLITAGRRIWPEGDQ